MPYRSFASPRWLAAMAAIAFFVIILTFMDTRYQPYMPLHGNAPPPAFSDPQLDSSSSATPPSERLSNYGGLYNDPDAGQPSSFAGEFGKQSEAASEYKELFPYGEEATPGGATTNVVESARDPPDFSQLFQSKSAEDVTVKLSGIPVPPVPEENVHDDYATAGHEHDYPEGSEALALYEAAHGAHATTQAVSTSQHLAHVATDLPAHEGHAGETSLAGGDDEKLVAGMDPFAPTTLHTSVRPLATGGLYASGAHHNSSGDALATGSPFTNGSVILGKK